MPTRREPSKPEQRSIRQPTPDERDERVAIPLEFEDALRGLLAVKPDDEPREEEPGHDG